MLINCLKKGGRERRMLELIKDLTSRQVGYEISLIALTGEVEYPYVYDLPVKFHVLNKNNEDKKTEAIIKIRKIIKEFQPDIIHSWDIKCSGYVALSNLFLNIPVIQGVIYDASTKSSLAKLIRNRIKLLSPVSKAFIANSQAGLKAYNPPAHKSVCIYNGIDLNRFNGLKSAEQTEKEITGSNDPSRFIVAMVAAFEIRKDYDTLLKAAISMCQEDQNIVFLLIGTGENLERIKAATPSKLLSKQIFFPGIRNDIESILQIINAGLLITNSENHGEGISNAIIEYMASGKPVIATRGGGTNELVKNEVNGFLIDPHNSEQIIEKIETLKSDPALAARMGEEGRQWIKENFEITRMTDEYISLYKKLQKKKETITPIQVRALNNA